MLTLTISEGITALAVIAIIIFLGVYIVYFVQKSNYPDDEDN
jgi:hypothetical protein